MPVESRLPLDCARRGDRRLACALPACGSVMHRLAATRRSALNRPGGVRRHGRRDEARRSYRHVRGGGGLEGGRSLACLSRSQRASLRLASTLVRSSPSACGGVERLAVPFELRHGHAGCGRAAACARRWPGPRTPRPARSGRPGSGCRCRPGSRPPVGMKGCSCRNQAASDCTIAGQRRGALHRERRVEHADLDGAVLGLGPDVPVEVLHAACTTPVRWSCARRSCRTPPSSA